MSDDLQKLIQEALANRLDKDHFIQKFREALEHNGALGLKLEDTHEYAQRRGEASSGALLDIIKSGVLPNERMDFDIANQTVRPLLEENFDDVQDAANQVQKAIDRAQGIGLNGVNADFPEDRAAGLIDKLTDSETIEAIRQWLGEPIVNFSAAAFDQWVWANADFRYKAGMSTKVIRKGHFGMCPWCAALVGTYDYEAVRYGSDVWRRHKHCKCTVTYVNGGIRQDVWSKRTWQTSPEILQARKITGADIQRGVKKELTRQAKSDNILPQGLVERIAEHPAMLGAYSPRLLKAALENAGYAVKPLSQGRLKGVSFENGGGFKVNFGGSGLLQYHPDTHSHHGGAYYKISTEERGIRRYDLKGKEKPED